MESDLRLLRWGHNHGAHKTVEASDGQWYKVRTGLQKVQNSASQNRDPLW